MNQLESIDWRIDYVLSSAACEAVDQHVVILNLTVDGESFVVELTRSQFLNLQNGFLVPIPY